MDDKETEELTTEEKLALLNFVFNIGPSDMFPNEPRTK